MILEACQFEDSPPHYIAEGSSIVAAVSKQGPLCDTVDKSMSNRCTLRIVFVYEDFERREVDRSENLTYISAQDEKVEVFPAEHKRR